MGIILPGKKQTLKIEAANGPKNKTLARHFGSDMPFM
jgi:hypothetical protein